MSAAISQLNLAPLGAGDLIDRAVRLYRRHFMTLIRIAAPPVVVSTVGSVMWTVGWRGLVSTGFASRLALYSLLMVLGGVSFVIGHLLNLIVIGGATRNLVSHLLWNEPVSARTTYRHVRARFWGLLLASVMVTIGVGIVLFIVYVALVILAFVITLGMVAFAQVAPAWLSVAVGVIVSLAALVAVLSLFFFLAGRLAYVPQVMLVEGKGVFDAIFRSFTLARGNVRRLMAMALFSTFATYSALLILIIPLGWYGYVQGVDPSPLQSMNWPAWYAVGYAALTQSSYILLAPIWIVGLSLLYVDERVRHEGYDIELMAARQLPELPQLPPTLIGGYNPALAAETPAPTQAWPPSSTLGLG